MERPKVGVGVIIVKEGKILLGERKNAHGEGTWCPPSGHLELGESYEECAKRETFEETGLQIKNLRFITATNDIFSIERHYVTISLIADYHQGIVEVKEPEKCETWQWFSFNDLPEPLFLPTQNLLKQGFNPLASPAHLEEKQKYKHYKSSLYELISMGKHSETQEDLENFE